MRITFEEMDNSEVCPDGSKIIDEEKPELSAEPVKRARFKPKSSKNITNSVLELILDPEGKTVATAQDRCFRLNGELIPLPQTHDEEQLMDDTMWEFMMKRASSNLDYLVDNHKSINSLFDSPHTLEKMIPTNTFNHILKKQ